MSIYDFQVKNLQGNPVSLKDYQGKVLLIVNTATRCGLTPQYEGLESLYKKYKDKGLEILDFPCNQFLEQAPEGNEEIQSFCQLNYGTTFPRFAKLDVNGETADPLFVYLKQQKPVDKANEAFKALQEKLANYNETRTGTELRWNFTKFLINRDGDVVERFAPTFTADELASKIEKLL